MKKTSLVFTITSMLLASLLTGGEARAQTEDVPKVEVGVQFSSLTLFPPDTFGDQTEPGFGGRLTYNLNNHIAVEAEGNFYPHKNFFTEVSGGRTLQAQFGVKAGKRFEKFGIFGKVRPGLISFSETVRYELEPQANFIFIRTVPERKTHFSTDVGGVLEFYPSRRIVARFDAGDTIIRYGEHESVSFPVTFGDPVLVNAPARTKHNFQFTAGVGFRFMEPDDGNTTGGDAGMQVDDDHAPRFEIGAQFTSLSFNPPAVRFGFPVIVSDDVGPVTEPGFGGRFTFNLNDHIALEAEGNFFTRENFTTVNPPAGHAYQGQFGIKAGKRYEKFGIFGKARPGFVGFTRVVQLVGTRTIDFNGQQFTIGDFRASRKEYFSTDFGGVLEFYPSRRLMTRFDFGDTIIRYTERKFSGFSVSQAILTAPPETKHNFQFSAGIGLRF